MDDIKVDIPIDMLVKVASNIPNLLNTTHKYKDWIGERSFILNFLQKKSKTKQNAKLLKDALKAQLTPFWDHEPKQRVLIFMLLDHINDGKISFTE
jgi:hypothetical protein